MASKEIIYPLVSVIVPTYNRPHLLGRTISSLLGQSYPNTEIVLVNDGGVDVQEIVDSINKQHQVVKYINLSEHKGAGTARNTALDACRGSYICFLDDDDIFLPYTLEFRMHMMKKLRAEVVYTRALRDIWETKDGKYVSIHKELYWDCAFNKDLLLIQNVAPICCILFSRKAWDNSGNYKFDTDLETGEDYDFFVALSRKTDFKELLLVDVEASYRKDKSQATGAKDFSISYPIIYKRWRDTAIEKERVIESQNAMLKQMGKNPADYGLEA